jgi:hypothetical protein
MNDKNQKEDNSKLSRCLTDYFKALNSYGKKAYKEPVWIVVTLFIFVPCFTFLVTPQSLPPSEQTGLDKTIYEWQVQQEDSANMDSLTDEIIRERALSVKPFNQYLSLITDISSSKRLRNREQEYEELYNSAVAARNRVEMVLAKVKGINFRVDIFNEVARMSEELLAGEISMLKIIEDHCTAYLAGDDLILHQGLQQDKSRLLTMINEQETAIAQWQSMKPRLDSTVKLKSIEYENAIAQVKRNRFKGQLKYPALAISLGYIITFGYCVFIHKQETHAAALQQKQAAALRQKQLVAARKKRGKKR